MIENKFVQYLREGLESGTETGISFAFAGLCAA